mmetsp:Transcript_19546/g.33065  ORF Transcript_19546/g.33065 Transcript_19546/m.33065 type:complete len:281 (-) Transcript_19546:94-936(-)
MKRSSAPNISAPLSRSGARRKTSSFINPICVAATISVLILISLGGTLLFFASSGNNSNLDSHVNNNEGESQQQQSSQLRRQQSADIISGEEKRDPTNTQGLLIRADQIGDIRIAFRPDLAGPSSIQYVIDVVEAASVASSDGDIQNGVTCSRCNFYRAEPKLLLQGVIAQHSISSNSVSLGPCPEKQPPKSNCPEHDPNCGCHGPIMTKGMVGWAGGGEGPDFFLNTFDKPVDWWEHQHTVWGELDEESIRVVESAYDLPAHKTSMRMLDKPIEFSIELF